MVTSAPLGMSSLDIWNGSARSQPPVMVSLQTVTGPSTITLPLKYPAYPLVLLPKMPQASGPLFADPTTPLPLYPLLVPSTPYIVSPVATAYIPRQPPLQEIP